MFFQLLLLVKIFLYYGVEFIWLDAQGLCPHVNYQKDKWIKTRIKLEKK